MIEYDIKPYLGVGELRFGMMQDQVAAVLGPPELGLDDAESGTFVEHRYDSALQTSYDSKSRRLVLVSMYSPLDGVRVGGRTLRWDESRDWYRFLAQTDPSAREAFGISVFFGYGIATSGLLSEERGDKSVTAFENGQWDENDVALKLLPAA